MKKQELKQLIKEILINELDISKYIGSWVDTKKLKKPSNFPEAIFLYLKKEGYTNKGEIYRIITLDPLVVMIKQNTEYIDLYKFLEDNQNIEPYSDLYSTYQDEKEVVLISNIFDSKENIESFTTSILPDNFSFDLEDDSIFFITALLDLTTKLPFLSVY